MPTVLMLTQCTEARKVQQAIMHALNSRRGLLILTVTSRCTLCIQIQRVSLANVLHPELLFYCLPIKPDIFLLILR